MDNNHKNFTLYGEIQNQDTGIIILNYFADTILITDTAKLKNGKFFFTGRVYGPVSASLYGRKYSELARIYIEPQKMKISIFKDKPLGSKMTGSKTQNEYDLLVKMEEPIYERIYKLRAKAININDSIKKSKDETVKLLLQKKYKVIDSLWSEALEELDPIELKFVLENPKSFVTLDHLSRLESRGVISLDSLKTIFNGLDSSLRKSLRAKYVAEDIRKKENVRIGNQAPDFKATGLNQQAITLSQFKGTSIVLLDFWASWCVPCRQSIPHLKGVYNKYHSRGLTVIAVSVDEKRKAWIDAVKQDSTEMWYHILVAEKWPNGPWTNDDIFQNYYYSEIPEQFIIDKNGKIIDRIIGYSKENEDSLDKLLKQIFND
jgi:peroxiredoxin